MSKVIASVSVIVIALSVFIGFFWYDNFKLSLTKYWWYFTIDNNPLLGSHDKDLKDVQKSPTEPRIYIEDLLSWWPWKDGIPSIDRPQFEKISETEFEDEELVVWVYLNWEARAYPYWILNWHEIVNDRIWDTPISVTLCPLCDTIPVFIRKIDWVETTFWVSWKLFQSCLVMYDRLSDTLWSQPWWIWVAWKHVNNSMIRVPAVKTTLWEWRSKHPESLVLSSETWYDRDYFRYPYWDYYTNKTIIFPARNQEDLNMHPKENVSYIWKIDWNIPKNVFSWESTQVIHEEIKNKKEQILKFNWKEIKAIWDKDLEAVRFMDWEEEIPSSTAFWFVYPAFFE